MDTPAIPSSAGPVSAYDPKLASGRTSEAASQFEALLIASMLKASRESGASWLGTGDDAAGASAISYAEEHLAQVLASQGGLGIARMVVAGLENQNRPYATANPAEPADGIAAAGNSPAGQ